MIYKKIADISRELGVVVKNKKNPYFKSMYFDINTLLEKLQPILQKHKVGLYQPLTYIGERPSITTIVVDLSVKIEETKNDSLVKKMIEDGQMIQFTIPLPLIDDPQKMGSAITYYRRYALQSLFLLQAEDDDGEGAVGRDVKKTELDF